MVLPAHSPEPVAQSTNLKRHILNLKLRIGFSGFMISILF